MHTRRFLLNALGAVVIGCAGCRRAHGAAGSVPPPLSAEAARAQLHTLFDQMAEEFLQRSPEHATALGVDTDRHAVARSKLDDRSEQGIRQDRAVNRIWERRLKAFDRDALAPEDQFDYDVIRYLRERRDSLDRFPMDVPAPYVVTQQSGAYASVPDLLVSQHTIRTSDDVSSYLARLRAFAAVLDQETARIHHQARSGILPPDFILDRTIPALDKLAKRSPGEAEVVRAVAAKASAAGLPDPGPSAQQIYTREIGPALSRQLMMLRNLRAKATDSAGVWKLPEGNSYYAACLAWQTTTGRSAADLAELGRDLVGQLTSGLNDALVALGRKTGTIADRLREMRTDPALAYPSSPQGRQEALTDARRLVSAMESRLPSQFGVLPKTAVAVQPVAADRESGSPFAFYDLGTIDGTRPGVFYLNLGGAREHLRWEFPTLVYHEAVPGHHMHGSIQQGSTRLPMIRKTTWFNAFNEGWALYAEHLADEMGVYSDDPLGKIGYLSYALTRACRLVVDTGLHAQRWTREQAITYLCDTIGFSRDYSIGEVDRYCVLPGQACSYMVGREAILEMRSQARKRQGAAFDSRRFHDTILLGGSAPLALLADSIERAIRPSRV